MTASLTPIADEENPPILIASDKPHDAEVIARVLGEEFARVHVCTDPKRAAQDLVLRKPAVLVLAFDTFEKAERCFETATAPDALVQVPPLRVLLLCGQEDLREAYEACRKGRFDDFVLFWPRGEETRPLRMAVRRALGQVAAQRDGVPATRDFAAQARRVAAGLPLLEQQLARADGEAEALASAVDAVRALGTLAALAERVPPLVLVVDDDRFQHKLLAQVLAPAKVELAFAANATEAIVRLHRRRPDLILMDVSLPDLDGVQATKLLKAADGLAAIPVIMVTGVGGREMVLESLKAGAADFVVKPFDKASLLAKVRKVIWGRAAA